MPSPCIRLRSFVALAAGLVPVLIAGCADGPVPEMRYLNPWIREEWAKDEQSGPTYHRKVADLAALREQARSLPPETQEQVVAQLTARLHEEPSPVMRAAFVQTLGEFPVPAAGAAVLAAASDESPHVRSAACKALSQHPTQDGFLALSQAVSGDSDQDVRIAAARGLGQFQDFQSAPALRPALDDNDPALQIAAIESLQSLTGRTEYGSSVATWRAYLDGGNPAPPPPPSIAEHIERYRYWF
jgi:hypothetical protein